MADDWLKFGMVERLTLGIILLTLGAMIYATWTTLIRQAGNWTPEAASTMSAMLLVYLIVVGFLIVGGPLIRMGWTRIEPRLRSISEIP